MSWSLGLKNYRFWVDVVENTIQLQSQQIGVIQNNDVV